MNNTNYIYIDGDNIGLKIELNFMENNEVGLIDINNKVKNSVTAITEYLLGLDQEIIFSGADGIICKGKDIDIAKLLNRVRSISAEITFSFGIGKNLKDAYIALRYAKSAGKNTAARLENDKFSIVIS